MHASTALGDGIVSVKEEGNADEGVRQGHRRRGKTKALGETEATVSRRRRIRYKLQKWMARRETTNWSRNRSKRSDKGAGKKPTNGPERSQRKVASERVKEKPVASRWNRERDEARWQ